MSEIAKDVRQGVLLRAHAHWSSASKSVVLKAWSMQADSPLRWDMGRVTQMNGYTTDVWRLVKQNKARWPRSELPFRFEDPTWFVLGYFWEAFARRRSQNDLKTIPKRSENG